MRKGFVPNRSSKVDISASAFSLISQPILALYKKNDLLRQVVYGL